MANNGVFYSGGTGGTGLDLTSGGVTRINISTGGTVTFNSSYSFPTADGDANEVLITNGSGNVSFNTIPNTSLDNSSITINGTLVSLGGSITVGDITSVVAGNGLTGGGTTGDVTLTVGAGTLIDVDANNVNVDLSELTTSTSNGDGDYFAVIDTSGVQKKLTKANINISGFNNDAGYITSEGNTNIYSTNGSLTGNRILTQATYNLDFSAGSDEYFQIYSNDNVPVDTPRVRMEADSPYTTVLELQSTESSVYLIDGYDTDNVSIFNVDGSGNLFAVSKSFLIEHPSKPEFNLRHGSLEGPEHGVYVRGKLDGDNVIELPDYWIDLVDESTITVQLTPIGSHQNLYVKDIYENMVVVNNSALLSSKIKCFYFIQAERKDIDKMVVEYPKGTQSI